MKLLKKRFAVDTITENGLTFDANLVVSFTIVNKGQSDCQIGYKGGAPLITVEKGTSVEMPGDSGYTWDGIWFVRFIGSSVGYVEIRKAIASTEEETSK